MEKLLQFFMENWKELSVLFVAVLTFLVSLFRKKGKVDPVIEFLLANIPHVINVFESRIGSGHGEEKKRSVMSQLCAAYKNMTGVALKEGSNYYKMLSEYVEEVLSTPHKKEDK